MFASSLLLAALALPTVLAGPALRLRQSGCNSGTPGEFGTAPNITLNALDTNAANSGGQGLPLVALITSVSMVEAIYVLATQASASTRPGQVLDFSLENGVLAPIIPNTFSGDLDVQSGDVLQFASGNVAQLVPAEYCGFANTDPNGGGIAQPLLGLNGDTSDFALCMSGDLDIAVFQPTADNGGAYSLDSCTSVDILIFEQ
ncbi:hypothetical protein CERSUDRAFT_117067 [Gelatoporia subvermispora B]|uniref:Ubiquitin 3 binding protein But2 C-terminal domain-containing protein n=1 Tax=Ceriporiopsis subvermispora (strain B) TaxID=914234 RepID=M2QRT2_CERS8|nr:hypothetical protein CERSUDRAFT_117067 [Gelatoporia subvermispora B]